MLNYFLGKNMCFLCFFFLSTFFISAQDLPEKENDTIIVWTKDRKLTWIDFQKKAHENTKAAQSEIGIDLISIPINQYDYKYIVLNYFYKIHSSTNSIDLDKLQHEQLHFDIAEVYSRKMREVLIKLSEENFNLKKYNNEIDLIYEDYFSYQEKYDSETNHSLITEKQKEWEGKIKIELHNLNSFTSEIYN